MTRKTAKRQVIGFPPDFLKDIEEVIQAHEAITGITLSRVQALKYGVSTMLMIQNGDALYQTKETVEKQMQQLCTQAAALGPLYRKQQGRSHKHSRRPIGSNWRNPTGSLMFGRFMNRSHDSFLRSSKII